MIADILEPFIQIISGAPVIRAILAFILMFFLPGFAWTLVFFGGKHKINVVERLALSIGLSIAIVTLSIISLNILLGISISAINAGLIILAVTVVPFVWYGLRRIASRREDSAV